MFEQMKRAALLLVGAALFAPLTWGAATLTQDNAGIITVASEYFGKNGARDVVVSGRTPTITLTVGDDTLDAGGMADPQLVTVDEGNTATVKFTFIGATLGAAVGSGALKAERTGTADGSVDCTVGDIDTTVSRTEGGASGDSSVSFEITVGDDELRGGGNCVDKLVFTVPNLTAEPINFGTAASPIMGAAVTAGIDQGRTSGDPLPNEILGTGTTPPKSVHPMNDGQVLLLMPAITAVISGGTNATVSIRTAEERRQLIGGTYAFKANTTDRTGTNALLVGNLTVAIDGTPQQLRNNESVESSDDDLASNAGLGGWLKITVSTDGSRGFAEGDKVYYGPNGSAKEFTADEAGGTMSYRVPIGLVSSPMMVRFVPNGTTELRPMTLIASLALEFTDPLNLSAAVGGRNGSSVASISFSGIATKAYAYGVVRSGGTDMTLLRVGCLGGGWPACAVFADCKDQAGNGYFGELALIPDGNTKVYTSDAIAASFAGGRGWERGRGTCNLLSNGALEVQHMVRSSGVQTNHSVVIGSGTRGVYRYASATSTDATISDPISQPGIGILGK